MTATLSTPLAEDARALPARAAAHPGIEPRLAVPAAADRRLDLAAERALGTYRNPLADGIVGELERAGLRGRGGAAFSAHVKWRTVAASTGATVAVANGEEGEPASAKDRWLLTHRPHLVLDGLLLAARTVGAARAIVYLSHEETAAAVRDAIAELAADGDAAAASLEVHEVASTYVAGEESALVRAINGGPALPTAKPPRPFERGVDGLPTLVSNVETLAHAAVISRIGAEAFRAYGTAASPGTALVTLSGACGRPGVYEVPLGLTVEELFEQVGGGLVDGVHGFLAGGWFGGVLRRDRAGTACCYDALRAAGSGLGCGAFTALGPDRPILAAAAEIGAWYAAESAAQCGVCLNGTRAIGETFARVRDGQGRADDHAKLVRWGQSLPGRGACAFLDGAATLARSVAGEYPEEFPGESPAPGDAGSAGSAPPIPDRPGP
ncbi:NADH-ubiquinone oxidoreductase-F iron-sulfur binding region domain-containing protein [Uniformispora flossi]|uniref:NADH-ubiquinone oxidoreductase-F iron-sulfur binding region domain-containing protein n=1 Tax=Uniformispora flossi TaxID=3390723 RepID=UPI003C2C4872